ncbi:MAG TPA: ArsA family ATPase [Syntrophorhabdaceae bacterium]|nr:ArsA family ATPase [Syntrophorhabdaceae bacterium]
MGAFGMEKDQVKLIMVGGKGGVGKTTCAAAIALRFARDNKKVLVISSDPAPSLSDIFEKQIGDREVKVYDDLELYGLEVSSDIVLKRWKERFGAEIYEVVSCFAAVDYDFVDYIGGAPGIEEEYMLNFIMELVMSKAYDIVVWDTAPAGHTLRLLKLPQLFLSHMEAATKFYMNMYGYLEKLKDALTLAESKRTLLEIIAGWEALAEKIVAFIRDPSLVQYLIVTIPEALGVKLTQRVIGELEQNNLKVENIIINHVIEKDDCEFHRMRRLMQRQYIDSIRDDYGDKNIMLLYLAPYEIKGYEKILEVSKALFPQGSGWCSP